MPVTLANLRLSLLAGEPCGPARQYIVSKVTNNTNLIKRRISDISIS